MGKISWNKYARCSFGIGLRSRDLLNFGQLYSNNGKWQDKQVVAAKWVEESFRPHVQRPEGRRKAGSYGYQFWLWQDTINDKLISIVACVGNGDQRIFFDKTNDLVVVVTALVGDLAMTHLK